MHGRHTPRTAALYSAGKGAELQQLENGHAEEELSDEESSSDSDVSAHGRRRNRSGDPCGDTLRGKVILMSVVLGLVAAIVVVVAYFHRSFQRGSGQVGPLQTEAGESASSDADAAPAGTAAATQARQCTSQPSDECAGAIEWARSTGIYQHPQWYSGLTPASTADEFQAFLARDGAQGCTCEAKAPEGEDIPADTMSTTMPCGDRETCLEIVDAFLDGQPRSTYFKGDAGLMQTFGANTQGGGDCGEDCALPVQCPDFDVTGWCRYDTYDNALAAIYYTMRGKYEKARRILDAFVELLYPGKELPGNITYGERHGLPSRRWLTLLAASYTPIRAKAGDYWGQGVGDGAVDVGNNAWVAIAFARYSSATSQPCFAVVARDILQVIVSQMSCNDEFKGFMARLMPYPNWARSTEHNIDTFALARMLQHSDAQERATTFVSQMFGYSYIPAVKEAFSTGTSGRTRCNAEKLDQTTPVDCQLWNILADADSGEDRKRRALKFSLRPADEGGFVDSDLDRIGNSKGDGKNSSWTGFRFSTFGDGVQGENTASGVMAMIHFRELYGAEIDGKDIGQDIDKMREQLKTMLGRYGSVLASVRGGNTLAFNKHDPDLPYPGGSDSGFGTAYFRYPHVASTAWTGMLLIYQADQSQPVDVSGNPYATPTSPVADVTASAAAADECLPARAVADDPSCQAHPACAGLQGDCCPTSSGANLGCC